MTFGKPGQRGGFVLGLVVGLLVGLSLALGVALYITKAPVPFVNKVPPRTAEQDRAEAERNRNWDPNAPLAGRPTLPAPTAAASAAPAASAAVAATPASAPRATGGARDPAAILAGGNPAGAAPADPFVYFVQVGAFQNPDDAEQQRARLAMTGWTARITEREQSGRTVYRVRVGPYEQREEAESSQGKLTEGGFEARLVRVERTP
jgi:cell division protein FtsN